MGSEDYDTDLHDAIGHYAVAVAEQLLADGLPVGTVYVDAGSEGDGEVEAGLHLGRSFQTRISPEVDQVLLWSGRSGWGYRIDPMEGPHRTRWVADGLTPAPGRVAAFLAGLQLDPATAGSGERPYYDTDRTALMDRLAPFTIPPRPYAAAADFAWRMDQARSTAYHDRVVAALQGASQDGVEVTVRLHPSELQALRHILEAAELTSRTPGVDDLAHHLAADLAARAAGAAQHTARDLADQIHAARQRRRET